MAAITMTSCETGALISPSNEGLTFDRRAEWKRVEPVDFGDRLHDTCSLARRGTLARRPNRIEAAAAAATKTRRRRMSGQR